MPVSKTFRLSRYVIRCQYLGRETGGFSEHFAPKRVAEGNIAKLRVAYGAKFSVRLRLGQTADVALEKKGVNEVRADAFISNSLDYNIFTAGLADCAPIILYSKERPLIAFMHGGRRNIDQGIIERTLESLIHNFHAKPDEFLAYIGPGIKKESYVLPISVLGNLKSDGWKEYASISGEVMKLDIAGFARYQLERVGILADNIMEDQVDTAADDGYYSHYNTTRFDDGGGRNGFVVCMST